MRLEQGKLCLCIRKAEQSFKQLFSQKRAFSEHMEKWQDDDLYDMYDHNQFVPLLDDPTGKELEQANCIPAPARQRLSKDRYKRKVR